MIALLLLLGVGQAVEPLVMPPAPATAPGECSETYPIRAGSPVPLVLLGDGNLAGCSAVCEPLSSYAHLLQIEQFAKACQRTHEIDLSVLTADRDHWRAVAQSNTNSAWYRQPWFVAVTSTALVAAGFVSYDQIRSQGDK